MLIVDVAPDHQNVLPALLQQGAVAHIWDPQELSVLQAKAIPVSVDNLDVIASLLTLVQFPKYSSSENKVLLTVLPLTLSPTSNPLTIPTMPSR